MLRRRRAVDTILAFDLPLLHERGVLGLLAFSSHIGDTSHWPRDEDLLKRCGLPGMQAVEGHNKDKYFCSMLALTIVAHLVGQTEVRGAVAQRVLSASHWESGGV